VNTFACCRPPEIAGSALSIYSTSLTLELPGGCQFISCLLPPLAKFLHSMSIHKRSIMSGVLGATASFVAKLALAPESPVPSAVDSFCRDSLMLQLGSPENHIPWLCPAITLVTRGVCLLCMVMLNVLMLSSFLDGMNESGSVVGTALSTAANFSSSVSCQPYLS